MEFSNVKLRKKVRDVLGSEAALAHILELPRSALSARFSGKTDFSRTQIKIIIDILKIPASEIHEYFFDVVSTNAKTDVKADEVSEYVFYTYAVEGISFTETERTEFLKTVAKGDREAAISRLISQYREE